MVFFHYLFFNELIRWLTVYLWHFLPKFAHFSNEVIIKNNCQYQMVLWWIRHLIWWKMELNLSLTIISLKILQMFFSIILSIIDFGFIMQFIILLVEFSHIISHFAVSKPVRCAARLISHSFCPISFNHTDFSIPHQSMEP